jgi:hypothetical protein
MLIVSHDEHFLSQMENLQPVDLGKIVFW